VTVVKMALYLPNNKGKISAGEEEGDRDSDFIFIS
jgi:hypothetical protein